MKKLLALLLSLLLIVSTCSVSVFAEGVYDLDSLLDAFQNVGEGETITLENNVDLNKVTSLEGEGTEENPYLIGTLDELRWFRDDVNAGNNYSGKYIKLTSDINLNNENWTPIGNSTNKFSGHFDGGNNTVSNLKIDSVSSYVGFFGYTTNGSVKNITLHNVDIDGRLGVGALAGCPYTSDYDNIKLTGLVTIDAKFYVGGVVGRNAYGDLTNITVDVEYGSYVFADSVEDGTAYRTYVGGVVGFMGEGSQIVKNVTSNINVIGSTIDVGGISGIAHYGNIFENIYCTSDVTLKSADSLAHAQEIGGIAAVWHNETGYTTSFINCTYTGTLYSSYTVNGVTETVTDFVNGGIVGAAYNTTGEGIASINGVTVMGALPTATVTDIDLDTLKNVEAHAPDLTFAKKFVADSVSDAVFNCYKDWYADFVLTVNKDVSFNADGNVDGYLAGQYDGWGESWISVPFEDVTLRANESLKIMEYAASLMGQSGLKVTYEDVLYGVVEFDCGVFFTQKFMEENPDLVVSLELRIFNPTNETISYIIHEKEDFTLGVATVNGYNYDTFEEAVVAANSVGNAKIVLLKDITVDSFVTINKGANTTIDLNGHIITGTDTTEKNFGLIQNNGALTINDTVGTGKISLTATVNSGWNRYSAVISNNPGGTLIVNRGTIEHLGGTDMAYGIDSLTNGTLGDVNVTINGGTITSPYRAIRQFLNSTTNKNVLVINGGTITSVENGTAIFFHDPSTKANNGKITVEESAIINGNIYLFVTEGSTEWPVEVSISATALQGDSTVTSKNVPKGYAVEVADGIYGVVEKVEKQLNTEILCSKGYVPSNYSGWGEAPYSILFAVGIDSLDYSVGGFEITIDGVTKNFYINGTVWSSLTINGITYSPIQFGEGNNYIMYYIVTFEDEIVQANPNITVRAFLKAIGESEFVYSKSGTTTLV